MSVPDCAERMRKQYWRGFVFFQYRASHNTRVACHAEDKVLNASSGHRVANEQHEKVGRKPWEGCSQSRGSSTPQPRRLVSQYTTSVRHAPHKYQRIQPQDRHIKTTSTAIHNIRATIRSMSTATRSRSTAGIRHQAHRQVAGRGALERTSEEAAEEEGEEGPEGDVADPLVGLAPLVRHVERHRQRRLPPPPRQSRHLHPNTRHATSEHCAESSGNERETLQDAERGTVDKGADRAQERKQSARVWSGIGTRSAKMKTTAGWRKESRVGPKRRSRSRGRAYCARGPAGRPRLGDWQTEWAFRRGYAARRKGQKERKVLGQ
eukprot:1686591-Rhodomonas_salina.2